MTAARSPTGPFGPGHPGESLSALLDGELGEREAEAVGAHLAGCAACRREMQRLSEARLGLRAMTLVPAPPGMAVRTRDRIGWVGRAVALGAVMTAALAGVVLWAARPEPVVTALPPAVGGLMTARLTDGYLTAGPATTMALSGLPAGDVAPSVMDGMALAGMWRQDEVLAAVYGQGGSRLVLIEQSGRLIGSPGQRWTMLGGHPGELGAWGAETTFASQVGTALVVTVVGSGEDVSEAAASWGGLRVDPPWPYRARSLARSLVEDVTGG